MPLTERKVKYVAKRGKPYKLTDGGGLYVLIHPNGSKLWRMKYRLGDKEKLLSFGKYPDVSLAAAPTRWNEVRELLAQGQDPAGQRTVARQRSRTYEEMAREWQIGGKSI